MSTAVVGVRRRRVPASQTRQTAAISIELGSHELNNTRRRNFYKENLRLPVNASLTEKDGDDENPDDTLFACFRFIATGAHQARL